MSFADVTHNDGAVEQCLDELNEFGEKFESAMRAG